eukprot:7290616-Alexandrium_andersonii.AAC.1
MRSFLVVSPSFPALLHFFTVYVGLNNLPPREAFGDLRTGRSLREKRAPYLGEPPGGWPRDRG